MNTIKVIQKISNVDLNDISLNSHASLILSTNDDKEISRVEPKMRKRVIDNDFCKLYGVRFTEDEVQIIEVKTNVESYLFYIEIKKYDIKNEYDNIGYMARIINFQKEEVDVIFNDLILRKIVFDMRATWGIIAGYRNDWNEIWPRLIFSDKTGNIIVKGVVHVNEKDRSISEGIYGIQQVLEEIVLGEAKSYYAG